MPVGSMEFVEKVGKKEVVKMKSGEIVEKVGS